MEVQTRVLPRQSSSKIPTGGLRVAFRATSVFRARTRPSSSCDTGFTRYAVQPFLQGALVSHSSRKASKQLCRASRHSIDQAVSDPELAKLAATLLGYAVLAGSMVRSIPQIIRIVQKKSVEGLSLTSFVAELIAYTITWAYNFNLDYPFSSYGEVVACWVQDLVLIGLVLYHREQMNWKSLLWTLAFAAFTWIVMANLCGNQVLYFLQASTIVMISVGARMPQIWMNWKRGNSGELSLLTCLLNVMGCFTRMFTTFVLTKDSLNLIGAIVQAVLNGVLLYQTVKTAWQLRPKKEPRAPGLEGGKKLA